MADDKKDQALRREKVGGCGISLSSFLVFAALVLGWNLLIVAVPILIACLVVKWVFF